MPIIGVYRDRGCEKINQQAISREAVNLNFPSQTPYDEGGSNSGMFFGGRFANSDLSGIMDHRPSIAEADRAVKQLLRS
jgi:hypothetical protein